MNRKKKYNKRPDKLDIKYNSIIINKIICKVMVGGIKSRASTIVYNCLEKLVTLFSKENKDITAVQIVDNIINTIKPKVYLRSKRIAAKVYKIPIPITPEKAASRAIIWLINCARKRTEYGFENKLYSEIVDILKEGKGLSIKQRDDYHRIAKENEAFVHYA